MLAGTLTHTVTGEVQQVSQRLTLPVTDRSATRDIR
jgi:hypothetical protein